LPQLNSTMSDVAHIVRRPDGSVLGADALDPLQYGTGALHRLYQTSDGWVCLVVASDAEFEALSKVLELDLLEDPRFRTSALRRANSDALAYVLAGRMAAEQTGQLVADLRASGVPVVEPVMDGNRPAMDQPENRRLGRVGEFRHPRFGNVREVALPVRISDTCLPAHRRAPEFGEHTDEILADAGYSDGEIAELRSRHAVR
jgi:crotonobetainyl-CoA:carnitine CoA-transferase CaiB-like acyl-CoA transferase